MTREEEIQSMSVALWLADGAAHPMDEYDAEAKRRYYSGERRKDMPASWDIDDMPGMRG